jgi:hypothetical protein
MEAQVDWLAVSVGINIGFVASFFIRRRHIRRLWNWLRGRTPKQEGLQDVMVGLEPELTPLMEVMRRQKLPEGHPDHLPTPTRGMPPYYWQKDKNP